MCPMYVFLECNIIATRYPYLALVAQLSEPSQVQGAAFALQTGVDALLLRPDSQLWAAAIAARNQRLSSGSKQASPQGDAHSDFAGGIKSTLGGAENFSQSVLLSVGRVTRTTEGGVGDRVCVDLIQSLKAGEGMLVGSSAKMLALVHAETFETGFVPARWEQSAHLRSRVAVIF